MPKRKTKLQKRIDRLVREKYELLSKIERLLRERDEEADPALNAVHQGKRQGFENHKERVLKKARLATGQGAYRHVRL